MSLSPQKVAELKRMIHDQMLQGDIQNEIKDALAQSVMQKSEVQEDQVLALLKEKGIIDNMMSQLNFDAPQDSGTTEPNIFSQYVGHKIAQGGAQSKTVSVDPRKTYLYMQILGGKAFLNHLNEADPIPGQVSAYFTVHLHFCGQRFKSHPIPCACEPNIQEGFLLELNKDTGGRGSNMRNTSVLALSDCVHLVLLKTEPSGEVSLVSSQFIEWRPVLAAPNSRCTLSIELFGIGSESRVPIGILEVRLELIPRIDQPLKEDVIKTQCSLEKNKQAERERLFLVYAKQWWKEYLQIRTEHRERLVKIFAQDENRNNHLVCSFVKPMRAGRLLDTPRQAARFVSLISYERASQVGGGGNAEQWSSMHAFLCRNRGDCEDHAILLCSLLLGFGLDAYVCVGTKAKGAAHTWVLILGANDVTFWESLTGHRYLVDKSDSHKKKSYPYCTIGCVFNHTNFYANCQESDRVELCDFDFLNESLWKAMSSDAIQSNTDNFNSFGHPPLCPSDVDSVSASSYLEIELRRLVENHREDNGLSTVWDEHLSYLLTPALAAYETERVTGVAAGNEEFQQAIRRAVPDGHTFKGYPIQFVHRNARRVLAACLKSAVCEEILNCRGDFIRLAVRVKIFTYPENALAVWVMFACKYKSIV